MYHWTTICVPPFQKHCYTVSIVDKLNTEYEKMVDDQWLWPPQIQCPTWSVLGSHPGLHGVKPATNYNLHSWRNKEHIIFKICISLVHIFVSWYTMWVWNLFFQTKGRKYIREFKNMALGISEQKWEEQWSNIRGWSHTMHGIDCKCICSYVWKTYRANYIFKTCSCIWDTTKVNF